MTRREWLITGLAAGGLGATACRSNRSALLTSPDVDPFRYLCPPDVATLPPIYSPPARPFVAPLFVPPVKTSVPSLDPPPDHRVHQLWDEYPPKKFYTIYEQEFPWVYHPDPPYNVGTWSWGFDGNTPGPTYHARYGEPVLVRRFNDLPPVGRSNVPFALPSTANHLDNAHTASESDGYPNCWIRVRKKVSFGSM
jgi:hypothetical protein